MVELENRNTCASGDSVIKTTFLILMEMENK